MKDHPKWREAVEAASAAAWIDTNPYDDWATLNNQVAKARHRESIENALIAALNALGLERRISYLESRLADEDPREPLLMPGS